MHIYKIVVVLHITNNENKTTMTNLVGQAVTVWFEGGIEIAEDFVKVEKVETRGAYTLIEGIIAEGGRSRVFFHPEYYELEK